MNKQQQQNSLNCLSYRSDCPHRAKELFKGKVCLYIHDVESDGAASEW